MGVERDPLAPGIACVVGLVELVVPVERRTARAAAADHRLLLVERDAVPELDEHADDARDLVRAAGRPAGFGRPGLQPDEAGHLARVGRVRVRDPVLEAQQVARRPGRPRRALEAVDAPARLHRAARVLGQVAQRVQDRVGVVRADLDAEVAAALGRVQVVVREARHLASGPPVAATRARSARRRGCCRGRARTRPAATAARGRARRCRRAARPARGSRADRRRTAAACAA